MFDSVLEEQARTVVRPPIDALGYSHRTGETAADRLTLAAAEPDPIEQIRLLGTIDAGELPADAVVDLAAAWARVEAAVTARKLAAMEAVFDRLPDPAGFRDGQVATSELATALRLSERTVGQQLFLAAALAGPLAPTAGLMTAGTLSYCHAAAIADELVAASDQTAARIQAIVLPVAADKTPGELRRLVRRQLTLLAPDECVDRTKQTKTDRGVSFRPLPDSAAEARIIGPAEQVAAFYQEVDRLARIPTGPDDTRTLDQRRFDVATSLPWPDLTTEPAGEDTAPVADETAGERTVDETTGEIIDEAGADEQSADEAAAAADAGAADDQDGDEAGAQGAESADEHPAQDHLADELADPHAELISRLAAAAQPVSWRPPRGARRYGDVARPRVNADITLSLATLLGLADDPGQLDRYGPIPAELARRIATDATYRFLIHDQHGRLIHYDPRGYTPSDDLERHIVKRDRTCRFPGCTRPAIGCDIDHATPFDQGGPTDPHNCGCLCRHHHRLKTLAGWQLQRDPDGTCHWTSPTGKTYTRKPYNHHQQE